MKIRNRIANRGYEERDEKAHHIKSGCGKLAQKENKITHDWVEKVIHWELCSRLKLDHTTEWYIHKLELVLENDVHNIL